MSRKCTYTWEIKDFMYLDTPNGTFLQSPVFWVDMEYKWKLELCPRGVNRASRDYLSVYIYLISSSEYSNTSAKCEFALLDVNDRATYKLEFKNWENTQNLREGCGFPNFIHRSCLHTQDLPRGSLKLFCKVAYNSSGISNNISPYQDDEYAKMLMNTAFSDVTFQVGRKKFPAHKVILAAKSPTFYQTLQTERTGTIVIVNVTAEIFEEMLRFMYTGAVKNLHLHAKDLMIAAENYKVYDLRDTCVNYLIGRLTVDNAIDMVQFAQECHCQALEDRVLSFINTKFVKESPRYLVQQLTNVLKYSRLH